MFAHFPVVSGRKLIKPPFTEKEIEEMKLIMLADIPDDYTPWGYVRVWYNIRNKDCGCNCCSQFCRHLHKYLYENAGRNRRSLFQQERDRHGDNLMDKL